MKKILSDCTSDERILTTFEVEDSQSVDALLDEINKQKRQNHSLQAENTALRSSEARLQKSVERLRLENLDLEQQIKKMTQRLRELEIEISLPLNERTIEVNRAIVTPLPQPKTKDSRFTRFTFVAFLMVCTAVGMWKWTQTQQNSLIAAASLAQAVNNDAENNTNTNVTPPVSAPLVVQVAATSPAPAPVVVTPEPVIAEQPTTNQVSPQTAPNAAATAAALEEGYLLIDNPLNRDFMVRVYTGFQRGARELAFVNSGDKFRIRAQSPEKMRRQYVMNGKKITVEDYFYKISDREQWVFGFFTTKRTATITQ